MKVFIFTILCAIGLTSALDFPSYINRCSLLDPKLNDCIEKNGNLAIPNLVKGDEKLGIPVMSPLVFPSSKLEGKNLVISLKDAVNNDLKDAKIRNVMFDFDKKTVDLTIVIDVFNVLGEYSITGGMILSRPVFGSGKFNMTLIGTKLRWRTDIDIYEKDGEMYEKLVSPSVELSVDRGHYVFQNLKEGEDINAFIDEHWEVLHAETKSSLDYYFGIIIRGILDPIAKNYPISILYS